ncbi:Uncharacterised protein [Acinetobacter baumannii]|nr:Uncharacterised protein [Acinetobacter baumannii]
MTKVCQSLASASRMITSNSSAERIFTGFCRRSATAGRRLRTSMPMATGPRTMTKTCTTLPNCKGIACPSPMKYCSDRLTISGMVRMAITEFTAVRVMFSATSPCARWL